MRVLISWLKVFGRPGRRGACGGGQLSPRGLLQGTGRPKAGWISGLAAGLIAAGGCVAAASAGVPEIEVQRDGGAYSVRASADVAADLPIAWGTITDYEHLPEFVPDIARTRVLARDGNRLSVTLSGGLRLLFLEWPVRVRLAVQHEPYGRVRAQSEPGLVDGQPPTLRAFSGSYTLTVVPVAGRAGVRLDYEAKFELAEDLPPLIGPLFGRALVRVSVRQHFEAMLREIERRQLARPLIEWSTS